MKDDMSQPSTTLIEPRLVPLQEVREGDAAGGKAEGLARLLAWGLRVPPGFVLIGAAPGRLPATLDACASLGPLAVRSSAIGEDGADASFAGQFETVLHVEGPEALRAAVERCLASAGGERAAAYLRGMGAAAAPMCVVVQQMVDARVAGVLFTADPVTGDADRLVIEAVPGVGEGLVSGRERGDRYVFARSGERVEAIPAGAAPLLDEAELAALVREARLAEEKHGRPLDLEWAIDAAGTLFWLQARPITTLDARDQPDMNELDSPLPSPDCVLTTYNVAEVAPGAATPLGWSMLGDSMNDAMRDMYLQSGFNPERVRELRFICSFHGHIFLNLSASYALSRETFGTSKEAFDYAIAGRVLPPVELPEPAPVLRRALTTVRYFGAVSSSRKLVDAFEGRVRGFKLRRGAGARDLYAQLGAGLDLAREGWRVHLFTSSFAGLMNGLLLGAIAGGPQASARHHADAAALLAGAGDAVHGDGTTSFDLIRALDRLVEVIASREGGARFEGLSVDEALAWLRDPASGPAHRAFARFLEDHGHRCIRETEIRVADWSEDPRPLVANLQASVVAHRAAPPRRARDTNAMERVRASLPLGKRLFVDWVVPRAQDAAVLRERSKSLAVRMVRRLKPGFMAIAEELLQRGTLPDVDAVHFVTFEELGRLVRGEDTSPGRRALQRRRLHARKNALTFPRVSIGKPQPVSPAETEVSGTSLHGTPVSRGVVKGLARVARTPSEAAAMQPGEILVVPFTDVGWAPYFARAAGLATEIGGQLSHGAVVAREYGLPAVVNLPDATRIFKTGDTLLLDADSGIVRKL